MLHYDARALGSLRDAIPHPPLTPTDEVGADAAPPVLRMDVPVDADHHVRQVHHVGVSGDPPVRREHDNRLRGEVDVLPVVEHLLRGRAVFPAVYEDARRDQVGDGVRVVPDRCPNREAFGQSIHPRVQDRPSVAHPNALG